MRGSVNKSGIFNQCLTELKVEDLISGWFALLFLIFNLSSCREGCLKEKVLLNFLILSRNVGKKYFLLLPYFLGNFVSDWLLTVLFLLCSYDILNILNSRLILGKNIS
jgi:hypothetical protein